MRGPNDNAADQLGSLGPAIKQHPKPSDTWKPTDTKGIERNDKGELRTSTEPKPLPVVYWGVGLFINAE